MYNLLVENVYEATSLVVNRGLSGCKNNEFSTRCKRSRELKTNSQQLSNRRIAVLGDEGKDAGAVDGKLLKSLPSIGAKLEVLVDLVSANHTLLLCPAFLSQNIVPAGGLYARCFVRGYLLPRLCETNRKEAMLIIGACVAGG